MQIEITPNGGGTYTPECYAEVTYSESIEACGPATASIPAYLDATQEGTALGAQVVLRSAMGVEWFGRVDSYKDGVISCAGYHARLSDVPRSADYVNSTGVGFRPAAECSEAYIYSKDYVATLLEDGSVSVEITALSGPNTIAAYSKTGMWWYPRFRNARAAASSEATFVWHRPSTNWRLRVYSCDSSGVRGTKLWEQASGSGDLDGTGTGSNAGADDGNGFFFYIECVTAYTPGDSHVYITPRIYDVEDTHLGFAADPVDIIDSIIDPDPLYEDLALSDLDDLMFDLSSTDASKVAEVCAQTGCEFFWRWVPADDRIGAYFRTVPTTPTYYVDATDPNVKADLTFGSLKDYYSGVYIIGEKRRVASNGRWVATDPWCWDRADTGSNPLTAAGITRYGVVDVNGYVTSAAADAIAAAYFADNGRLKVSGTIDAIAFTTSSGTPVPASSIRCNEVVRVNTERGNVDARITAVDHVGELTANVTVGQKAADFEAVLARMLGTA